MGIKEVHNEFKYRFNRLNSVLNLDLRPDQIDSLLYRALIEILTKYNRLDVKYQNVIKDYIIGFPEVPIGGIDLIETGIYKFDLAFSKQFLSLESLVLTTSCGNIEATIISNNRSGSVQNTKPENSFEKPNAKWNYIPAYFVKGGMIVMSDVPITTARVSFIFLQLKPFAGDYDTIEYLTTGVGNTSASPKVELQCSTPAQNIVIDYAVDLALYALSNQPLNDKRTESILS